MADDPAKPNAPRRVPRLAGVPVTRLAIAAVALIYAILFVVLNTGRVRIHFVFFTVTTDLWVGLLVCLVVGALLGQAFGVYRRRMARPHEPS